MWYRERKHDDESHQLAVDYSQIDQSCGHAGVFGSKTFFPDFQRQLVKWNSFLQLPLCNTHKMTLAAMKQLQMRRLIKSINRRVSHSAFIEHSQVFERVCQRGVVW